MDYGDGNEDDKVDRHLRAQVFWLLAFIYIGFVVGLILWLG